jgi:membrane associated rhomboid family serine protease
MDFTAVANGAPGATVLLAGMVVASLVTLFLRQDWLALGVFRPYWWLRQRQYATPITSAFLHADLPHLLFNGFTFWAFGFSLERAMGTPPFLALYAVGIAVSCGGTWWKQHNNPNYSTLGASGAILAVLFASILYFPGASLFILPIPVPIPAPLFALGYLGYSVWASRRNTGRINHDAHLSGAVAGVLFVALTEPAVLGRIVRWTQAALG